MDKLNYCDEQSRKLLKPFDSLYDDSMSTISDESSVRRSLNLSHPMQQQRHAGDNNGNVMMLASPTNENEFLSHRNMHRNNNEQSTPVAAERLIRMKSPESSPEMLRRSLDKVQASDCKDETNSESSRSSSCQSDDDNDSEVLQQTSRFKKEGSNSANTELLKCQLSRLSLELKSEKNKNFKLTERLQVNDCELKTLRNELELQRFENREIGGLSGVVEEVYAAQKIRETAMLARMKQALQERDEAVLRAKAYMKDITNKDHLRKKSLSKNELSIDELIASMSRSETTPRACHKMSEQVMAQVYELVKQRDSKCNQQMKIIIDERDALKRKLHATKLDLEKRKSEDAGKLVVTNSKQIEQQNNQQNELLLCALKNMQTEYDRTVEDLVQKTDELETVRLQLSLEHSLKRNNNKAMMKQEEEEERKRLRYLQVSQEQLRYNEQKCERMHKEIESLKENKAKLERHVRTLQRKLAESVQKSQLQKKPTRILKH